MTLTPELQTLLDFEKEFSNLINQYSLESYFANIPDYILARHAMDSLELLAATIRDKDKWYDKELDKYK